MYNIAIVDDEWECFEQLKKVLEEYSQNFNVQFNVSHFHNGKSFLFDYHKNFDIVFMDVNMPEMSGFATAKELRKIDDEVILIFTTYLSKYANKGYEVDAMDYLIKPISYPALRVKIDKAISKCDRRVARDVMLPTEDGSVRASIRSIVYVEISGHKIVYHTTHGDLNTYGTLKQVEAILPKSFSRCNSCYLVNLRFVSKIQGEEVYLGDIRLKMSRSRKAEFEKTLHKYLFEGGD